MQFSQRYSESSCRHRYCILRIQFTSANSIRSNFCEEEKTKNFVAAIRLSESNTFCPLLGSLSSHTSRHNPLPPANQTCSLTVQSPSHERITRLMYSEPIRTHQTPLRPPAGDWFKSKGLEEFLHDEWSQDEWGHWSWHLITINLDSDVTRASHRWRQICDQPPVATAYTSLPTFGPTTTWNMIRWRISPMPEIYVRIPRFSRSPSFARY